MASSDDFAGLLCVGDPHLASRVPGFRKDDYPQTALRKLRWCLRHAREQRLLAVLLGDLFHYPRDNANWLVVEVMALLGEHQRSPGGGPVLAVWGNHDCSENCLVPDDTLSVVLASGRLHLVYESEPWLGTVDGLPVAVGGTCWGQELPQALDRAALAGSGREAPAWVVWLTHHDLRIPGAPTTGRLACREIPGVDLVVNGHIHYRLDGARTGATTWVNPGNISRVDRAAVTRAHVPSVLRIDVDADGLRTSYVPVPHEPFDAVFHPKAGDDDAWSMGGGGESPFVQGLKELQSLKTAEGAGLRQFLDQNLGRFDPRVAGEVRKLAKEVLGDADRPEPE